jgi:hypothetical protein
MVCYARPAGRFAVLLVGVLLVFGRSLSHFLDTAAFLAVATVTTGAAAIAAVLVFTAFMSTRRRRAAGGGCVSCQFRCQHAMTEPDPRTRPTRGPRGFRGPWLVSTTSRSEAPRENQVPAPPAWPGRTEPVLLPMPSIPSAVPAASAAPRWPDRPLRARDALERVHSA